LRWASSEADETQRQRIAEANHIATLNIRVRAGARREGIIGYADNLLRIAVQAPPVEGAANRALIRLLARSFHTSPSRVRMVRGEKSKIKTIELSDLTPEMLKTHLEEWMGKTNKTGKVNDA
jgi:uncharacterized protein (TIGR00251 family)